MPQFVKCVCANFKTESLSVKVSISRTLKLLHVPSGVLYMAAKPEHSSWRAVLDLRGHESNIEVDLSSTRSSPYSTCCRVSMNLKQEI